MKDEEMAEEYIKDNCIRWECDSLPVDDIAKENFLVGLKVGRHETIKSVSTETLLKELIDRKVIRSWYYNGTYHIGNELPK